MCGVIAHAGAVVEMWSVTLCPQNVVHLNALFVFASAAACSRVVDVHFTQVVIERYHRVSQHELRSHKQS